jgi:hypothetical protein
MSRSGESLEPDVAMEQIDRAEELVRSGRRWRSGSFAAVGLVTLGYFAVMGGVDYKPSSLLGIVMTSFPILAVVMMMEVLGKRRAVQSRQLMRLEYQLAAVYAVLACIAAILAVLLPQPMPAALSGVLPGVAAFIGAWRVARR